MLSVFVYSCLSWVPQYLNCPPYPTVLSRMGETIQLDNPRCISHYIPLYYVRLSATVHCIPTCIPFYSSMWDMYDRPLYSHVFQSYMSHCTMWGRWVIQFNIVCVPPHLSIISHCGTVGCKWTVHWTPICIHIPHTCIPTCSSYPTLLCGIRWNHRLCHVGNTMCIPHAVVHSYPQ